MPLVVGFLCLFGFFFSKWVWLIKNIHFRNIFFLDSVISHDRNCTILNLPKFQIIQEQWNYRYLHLIYSSNWNLICWSLLAEWKLLHLLRIEDIVNIHVISCITLKRTAGSGRFTSLVYYLYALILEKIVRIYTPGSLIEVQFFPP